MPVNTISATEAEVKTSDAGGLYPSLNARWPSLFKHPTAVMQAPITVKTITATNAEA